MKFMGSFVDTKIGSAYHSGLFTQMMIYIITQQIHPQPKL
jgi:hypothetical protein